MDGHVIREKWQTKKK